jgi:hypothetical protein
VQSQLSGRVLAAGERLLWFEPHLDQTDEPIKPGDISNKVSTLGDCWWDGNEAREALRPVRSCPAPGESSFDE